MHRSGLKIISGGGTRRAAGDSYRTVASFKCRERERELDGRGKLFGARKRGAGDENKKSARGAVVNFIGNTLPRVSALCRLSILFTPRRDVLLLPLPQAK